MMNIIPFVDLKAQTVGIQPDLEVVVRRVLTDCDFILGDSLAQFVNVKYAVGISSGLDALKIALHALGMSDGDEVIIPVNTYIATAFAVSAIWRSAGSDRLSAAYSQH